MQQKKKTYTTNFIATLFACYIPHLSWFITPKSNRLQNEKLLNKIIFSWGFIKIATSQLCDSQNFFVEKISSSEIWSVILFIWSWLVSLFLKNPEVKWYSIFFLGDTVVLIVNLRLQFCTFRKHLCTFRKHLCERELHGCSRVLRTLIFKIFRNTI